MPFLPEHPRFKGITLPPSGWALAVLLSLYIFTGLIGHDPWKHDDAISIGIAFDMAGNGHWLMPHLAGQAYPDAPFYYWIAAGFIKLFSWLLPAHDASRLASGLFTLLALEFILLTARELHGKEFSAVAPLILAGSIGFLFHAHEAQPMLAALAAHTAAYWALILMPRRRRFAAVIFGTAVALAFLADGLLPVLTLLPITVLSLWKSENRRQDASSIAMALGLALGLCALWLIPLYAQAPDYLAAFLRGEVTALFKNSASPSTNIPRYLNMLLWYAWPALPLAAWALWSKRKALRSKAVAVPALAFASILLILGFCTPVHSSSALLLLPPLVLLAVPGVATLRRGAANAFDWFSMVVFTFLAAVCWIVWNALVFGWPEGIARQAVRLEPGFVGEFSLMACAFSLLITLIWLWLIITSPRSPIRGSMHWMAGLTLFWILIAVLWMPWIDYGKTYRPLSASLAKALPAKVTCIANANVPDAILAVLDYFDQIRTVPLDSDASKHCNLLLLSGEPRDSAVVTAAGWHQTWEDRRPGDRHESDKFHLYRRGLRAKSATSLSDIAPDDDDAANGRR
ncbi:MAG: glycosyltransferase family 39 protein [Betaproteobacteria bacterium]